MKTELNCIVSFISNYDQEKYNIFTKQYIIDEQLTDISLIIIDYHRFKIARRIYFPEENILKIDCTCFKVIYKDDEEKLIEELKNNGWKLF